VNKLFGVTTVREPRTMPDTLLNMKAFLATARTSSFTEAARQIGTATSVVTKRVSQLEWALKVKLFQRTARGVALTEAGEQYFGALRGIVTSYDDIVEGVLRANGKIEGIIRIKAPTALTVLYLGEVLSAFQQAHPAIVLDLVVADRSVNPIEDGLDISLGILPAAYDGVVDEVIAPYPRLLVASPDYLARRGVPEHPNDLINHDCICFTPVGTTWTLLGPKGAITVNIRPKLKTNDSFVLVNAAASGIGIGAASSMVARDALRSGRVVPVLAHYPLPALTLRASLPKNRAKLARVQALLKHLTQSFGAIPPWQLDLPPVRPAKRFKALKS
jgi:DNA-binding transcriptional LysR family regulator